MKIQPGGGEMLRVSEIRELGAANANAFRDADGQKHIEIDLSQTAFIDSCGLGALIALHKTACGRKGAVHRPHAPHFPNHKRLETGAQSSSSAR